MARLVPPAAERMTDNKHTICAMPGTAEPGTLDALCAANCWNQAGSTLPVSSTSVLSTLQVEKALSTVKVSIPNVIWATANQTPSGTEHQQKGGRCQAPRAPMGTGNCTVNTGCMVGCEGWACCRVSLGR